MTKYAGGTESIAELVVWAELERVKPWLPCPTQTQYQVAGEDYSTRVDFAWPEVKVLLQVDGWEFHKDKKTFVLDRRKSRFFIRQGWLCVPFAGLEAVSDPEYCVEELFRVAGWAYPEDLPPKLDIDRQPVDAPVYAKTTVVVQKESQGAEVSLKRTWESLRLP